MKRHTQTNSATDLFGGMLGVVESVNTSVCHMLMFV